MVRLLSTLALIAAAVPALAQRPGPIKIPGLGECPDACISIRDGRGALMACCGDEADGCVDCAPDCVASCGDGKYGGCTDLGGGLEENCSKGCEVFCDGTDYTVCSIGGASLDPAPEGCP